MAEANWIRGSGADVIILKTKVKVRQDQHDELIDLVFSYDEWEQFIDAAKAGVYDLP